MKYCRTSSCINVWCKTSDECGEEDYYQIGYGFNIEKIGCEWRKHREQCRKGQSEVRYSFHRLLFGLENDNSFVPDYSFFLLQSMVSAVMPKITGRSGAGDLAVVSFCNGSELSVPCSGVGICVGFSVFAGVGVGVGVILADGVYVQHGRIVMMSRESSVYFHFPFSPPSLYRLLYSVFTRYHPLNV